MSDPASSPETAPGSASRPVEEPVTKLLRLLDIEQLELNLFRGDGGGGDTVIRIFGGQVIAQALAAACRTVEGRTCHSLHAYFIRPGDPSIPVIYEVDRARDGGSFTTRRVIAVQHGKQILNLAASFQVEEEGYHHQHDIPDVPGPEGLPSRSEFRGALAEASGNARLAEMVKNFPIEIREVDPVNPLAPVASGDVNHAWIRVSRPIEAEPWMQQCIMAYASDMNLLSSGSRPHAVSWLSGDIMSASLDHAMWFHGPVKADEWHLYTMDSPFAGGARSFNRGRIYDRQGRLVASVAQEGLMRPIKKKG
ncbi:acyl-CoA thioesterase-2 [Albimonas donghaensis]|uniref:Acyl-CoA thioesterase 2 n=1 Tax=Albimonas donghaensis TaxID=356660 RepID=A0A1H3A4B8_9RHOB|nr:acyl-CoA thioesterase-2 [Albimonas donghaensis]